MKLDDLFIFHAAKSKGFEDYQNGDVAFITNGLRNNGIQGYVTPKERDRIFNFEGICLSAFCEATVHKPPYLPRGNGGSGLLVFEPKEEISFEQLSQIAAFINQAHRWRFSYGRMVNKERVKDLEIRIAKKISFRQTAEALLPKSTHVKTNICHKPTFSMFNITRFFDLERGDFHALDRLNEGQYPVVSRVTYDNGVTGFYDKPKGAKVYPKGTITIATTTGDAFVQLPQRNYYRSNNYWRCICPVR